MRFLLWIPFILLFSLPQVIEAYGWGFVKSKDGEKPELGAYEDLIEPYHAFYMGQSNEKVIYLTFDNGYEAGYTGQILDVLEEHDVQATFFVTGHYAKEEGDLLKRMVNEGHIIGNHSYSHPDFTKEDEQTIAREIYKVEKMVKEKTGQEETIYVRPPRGTFDEESLKTIDKLGYIQVFWSIAFQDWDTHKGVDYAYDAVMEQIHPGAVILLHAVSQDNAEALNKLIVALKKSGYQFKSLDDYVMNTMVEKPLMLN